MLANSDNFDNDYFVKITNIFFSKKMYSGGVQCALSEENLVKLDYIPNILQQIGCPAKLAFRLQRGPKLAKSAIFAIFFGFSNKPAELLTLEENFLCTQS